MACLKYIPSESSPLPSLLLLPLLLSPVLLLPLSLSSVLLPPLPLSSLLMPGGAFADCCVDWWGVESADDESDDESDEDVDFGDDFWPDEVEPGELELVEEDDVEDAGGVFSEG